MDAGVPGRDAALYSVSRASRNVQTLPPELIDIVLSHTEDDVTALRACSLVCASWAALARPYLFHRVVCRPRVPSRTWDDFFRFLSTSPDLVGYVQRLTVDGEIPGKAADDLVVENVLKALDELPSLTRLCIRGWRFYSSKPVDGGYATMPSTRPHPRRLKLLSLQSCIVKRSLPLYHLLASISRLDTLVLDRISHWHDAMPMALVPDLKIAAMKVGYIHNVGFFSFLGSCLAPGATAGLSVSTRLYESRDPSASSTALRGLFAQFGADIRSLSVNVLGDTRSVVEPGALPGTSPGFPRRHNLGKLVHIRTIVLYLTMTTVKTAPDATELYARLLEHNWLILANLPTILTHIELHFQRYGPHHPSTLDDLRAIDGTPPAEDLDAVRWSTMDEGTLARFPDLEAFTCVLCDGGFVEQYGPFEGAEPVASRSSASRQQEYDDYVELLKGVLPRLDERGLLRFRMSEG